MNNSSVSDHFILDDLSSILAPILGYERMSDEYIGYTMYFCVCPTSPIHIIYSHLDQYNA